MTRFCRQRDNHSCGPIALLNVDKFFGHRVTYKHLPQYYKRARCRNPGGTYTSDISKILGRASRRSWTEAKHFLNEFGCIVIQTAYTGHLYLMVMSVKGNIGVVNYCHHEHTAIQITPQRGAAMLRKAFRTWYVSKPTRRRR